MCAPRSSTIALGMLALATVACSDSTASARQPLTLTLSTTSMTAPVASINPDLLVTTGSTTLDVTRAQVVLSEIELKGTSTAPCTSKETEECSELKLDPMLVDVPLGAMAQLDLGALVPAGTYNELSFKIDAVQSGENSGAAAFLAAHPDFQNVAVRVQGTYNGNAFVYMSSQDVGFEMEFSHPDVIGSGTNNLTIHVDVSSWFKDGSGNIVDPSNPANASLIDNNIKNSLHAFEDDNHDGVEDHS